MREKTNNNSGWVPESCLLAEYNSLLMCAGMEDVELQCRGLRVVSFRYSMISREERSTDDIYLIQWFHQSLMRIVAPSC